MVGLCPPRHSLPLVLRLLLLLLPLLLLLLPCCCSAFAGGDGGTTYGPPVDVDGRLILFSETGGLFALEGARWVLA